MNWPAGLHRSGCTRAVLRTAPLGPGEMAVRFEDGAPVVIANPSASSRLLRVLGYADRLAELQGA
jgi:hypothetical protein